MKIWYQSTINFDHQPNYRNALAEHFARVASPGVEVLLHGRDSDYGRDLVVTDLISSPIAYHMVSPPMYIRALLRAQKEGADAFVIGSFSEPILPELRSLARIPVISLFEASMLAACSIAPKIGFLALNSLGAPYIDKSVAHHKLGARVSGVHVVEGDFLEQALETMFVDPSPFLQGFVKTTQKAIAHGAQVVVPGEGVLAIMAARNGVAVVDGAPILDSIGVAALYAEFSVNMDKRTHVAQSRLAYPSPSAETLRALFGKDAA